MKDEKKRAGRNIKVKVTDDISHTGLTEEEYKLLEEHVNAQEMIQEIIDEAKDKKIDKLIANAGEQARLEAKIHNTYIVYMNDDGDVVKEYPNGKIEKINRENS